MAKLGVFNHVSLDGYFTGPGGRFDWAKDGNDDPEYVAFVAENAAGGGRLLFGRITYEMMASYWPTPVADQHDPVVAAGMNQLPKVVFSTTLERADWNNTELVRGDLLTSVRKMKAGPGPDMVILGSGTIVAQLARAGLIDTYQIMLDPVALGGGRSMFEGIPETLNLRLTQSRTFANGKVFLCYETEPEAAVPDR